MSDPYLFDPLPEWMEPHRDEIVQWMQESNAICFLFIFDDNDHPVMQTLCWMIFNDIWTGLAVDRMAMITTQLPELN